MLVYDVTLQRSFDRIESLFQEVERFYPDSTLKALIRNKVDLSDKRITSEEEARSLAEKLNILFWETSAKASSSIETAIEHLVRTMIQRERHSNSATQAELEQGGKRKWSCGVEAPFQDIQS
jgi:Ras-related protein Rab-18